MKKSIFLFYCLLVHLCSATTLFAQQNDVLIPGVKKIKDVIIYKDTMFYSAFPSAVKLSNERYWYRLEELQTVKSLRRRRIIIWTRIVIW